MFFVEKRTKNFCKLALALFGKAEAERNKSFLLLFFKKDGLSLIVHLRLHSSLPPFGFAGALPPCIKARPPPGRPD
jgi:hypothetical protein